LVLTPPSAGLPFCSLIIRLTPIAILFPYTTLFRTPVAGRDDVAVESVFGYFTRMLVLRGDLSGDVTVRDLVLRTRRQCLAAFAHQEVPFDELIADLPRDQSRNPLFQAMFTLHTTMDVSATGFETFQGVEAESFSEGTRHTVTDVAMDVSVRSTAISVNSAQDRMNGLRTSRRH